MSVVRGFGLNGKSFYTNVVTPREINLNFTVTPTNGTGVTSLKSNGYVENVFMHTSTTPSGNAGFTNPNPANGFALVQLKQNFNYFLGMRYAWQVPTATDTKVDNSALTVGQVYVITTLGDTTAAQWLTLGVPAGVTAAVGVVFTALLVGIAGEANTSTSRVQLPTTAAVDLVEVVGVTNNMTTSNVATNAGQWVTLQFTKTITTMSSYTPAGTVAAPVLTMNSYTPAGTNNSATPPIFTGTAATLTGTNSAPTFTGTAATLTGTDTQSVAAPATGSICMLQLYFDGSSVTIDGI